MAIEYTIEQPGDIVVFTVGEDLVLDDIVVSTRRALAQLDYPAVFNDLWDLGRVASQNVSSELTHSIASRHLTVGVGLRPPGRTALLVANDFQYALARSYNSWLGDHLPWESRIFRDREAAMAWLREH